MAVPIAVAFGAALRSKRLLRSLAGEEKSISKYLPWQCVDCDARSRIELIIGRSVTA